MRLTRTILTTIALGAIVLAAASCAKSRPSRGGRIELYPTMGTKGYISSGEDATFRATGFSIFGTKSNENTSGTLFMDNLKVSYTSGKWDYSGDQYWSPMTTHHFFGIYPYSAAGSGKYIYSYDHPSRSVTVTERASGDSDIDAGGGALEDIMYGYTERFYKIGDPIMPVELHFRHACAAITINIRNVSEEDVSSITGIEISNLYRSAESLTLSTESITWTHPSKGGNITSSDINTTLPTGGSGYTPLLRTEMIIPQDFTSVGESRIVLSFTVDFSGSLADKKYDIVLSDIPLPNGSAADNYKYLAGNHYKYNLDITGTSIAFSVSIADWIDDKDIELK